MSVDPMKPARDLLICRHLGAPETPAIRDRAAKSYAYYKPRGWPSPNMQKLAMAAAFELEFATTDEVQEEIDKDVRCSWFRWSTGIKNEQLTHSHGVLNAFPEACLLNRGFQDAAINLQRLANLCRLVDPFRIGRFFAPGMRSQSNLDADFLTPLCKLVKGEKVKRGKVPSAFDVAWLIQEKTPEVLGPNDHGLPPVYLPTTVVRFGHTVVVATPKMPDGKYGGPKAVWHNSDGQWGRSNEAPNLPNGEAVMRVDLPQGEP